MGDGELISVGAENGAEGKSGDSPLPPKMRAEASCEDVCNFQMMHAAATSSHTHRRAAGNKQVLQFVNSCSMEVYFGAVYGGWINELSLNCLFSFPGDWQKAMKMLHGWQLERLRRSLSKKPDRRVFLPVPV